MVTHSPATSEVGGLNPGHYVGKLVVSYQWSFTVQNLDQLYVLVSSTNKNSPLLYDLYIVESDVKTQIK